MSERTKHQKRVEHFMLRAGQGVPTSPRLPDKDVRLLRASLILEEAIETISALGFGVRIRDKGNGDMFEIISCCEPNLIEIADGCADLSVVTIGTLSACGICDKSVLQEVDASNLRKFGKGSYRRDDGKWMKPKDWKKPDLEKVLKQQGWNP